VPTASSIQFTPLAGNGAALPDPIDRLVVATARQLDATLLTAAAAILSYARGGSVRVHDLFR